MCFYVLCSCTLYNFVGYIAPIWYSTCSHKVLKMHVSKDILQWIWFKTLDEIKFNTSTVATCHLNAATLVNLETWTNAVPANPTGFTLPTHLSLSENVWKYCTCKSNRLSLYTMYIYVLIEQLWRFFLSISHKPMSQCLLTFFLAIYVHIMFIYLQCKSTTDQQKYTKMASFRGTFQNSRPAAANQNPLENVLASASMGRDRLPIRANWVLLVLHPRS